MSKKVTNNTAPKNNNFQIINIGDTVIINLEISFSNGKYQKIKYSEERLNNYLWKMTKLYFNKLGKKQNNNLTIKKTGMD